jgi:response regulator RpfG family c-di-GMP phosphodiesterase
MIIVSVEPRKVGYAVCNKLKRSSDLQHIPLILTSAEETPRPSSSTRSSSRARTITC